jgi:hypothetical protein
VAWESGLDPYFNIVNCSVGLDRQGTRQLINLVQNELDEMRESISGQIALSFVESGYGEQPQGKRWMKRRDKRASKEPVMSDKPASPESVKPMHLDNTSSGIDYATTVQSTALSDEDVRQMIQSNTQEMMDDLLAMEPVITKEDWDEAAQSIELGLQDVLENIPTVIHEDANGIDASPLIEGLPTIPQKLVKMQSQLTVAILDAILTPARLRPLLRKEFQSASTEIQKAYPPGSAAEQELIDKVINDVFEDLGRALPYSHEFINKR